MSNTHALPILVSPKRPDYRPASEIANFTNVPDQIRGSSLLVLADVENLSISAKRIGRTLCFETLARGLRAVGRRSILQAVFSAEPEDKGDAQALRACGWQPEPRPIRQYWTRGGLSRSANSDLRIAFSAGVLVTASRFETLILGSGDGELGCEIAAAVRAMAGNQVTIGTMSVPGSLSARLAPEENPDIDFNMVLGADCLLSARRDLSRCPTWVEA